MKSQYMQTQNEFIPYEQALALKELGFDKPCIKYYWNDGMFTKTYESPFNYNKKDNTISAPLYQQAFRWFREKYGIFAEPSRVTSVVDGPTTGFFYFISDDKKIDVETDTSETYEEAELECLKRLIEIVKSKK